jgi:hypothetical protein
MVQGMKNSSKRGRVSSMDDGDRSVIIVSTAAIPWLTGTAVNPCLRAAYLSQIPDIEVCSFAPFLRSLSFKAYACKQEHVLTEGVGYSSWQKKSLWARKAMRKLA